MTPEDQIRMLMEENARLREQVAGPDKYSQFRADFPDGHPSGMTPDEYAQTLETERQRHARDGGFMVAPKNYENMPYRPGTQGPGPYLKKMPSRPGRFGPSQYLNDENIKKLRGR